MTAQVIPLPERHALRVPVYDAITLADLILASAEFACAATELLLDNARTVQVQLVRMSDQNKRG